MAQQAIHAAAICSSRCLSVDFVSRSQNSNQAMHAAAICSSRCVSVDFNSGSQNCNPSCSTFRLSASSRVTTNSITNSVSNSSRSSSSRTGAIVGSCRSHYGRRLLPLSSTFQGLPVLQFHTLIAGLPVYKFGSFCGQVFAKLPTLSCKTFSTVNCPSKWHWIGILETSAQSSQRTRVRRENGTESSSEEADEKDGKILEDLTQEVEEAEGNDDNDSDTNGEEQGADRQEDPGQSGNGNREDEANQDDILLQNKDAEAAPRWKFWEHRQTVEDDVSLGFEDTLLLQDLESLTFKWRDFLDPTWENALALGFTALLTLALFKIFFQGALVVITIVASALKYTVLAAFLLGLLVFLM